MVSIEDVAQRGEVWRAGRIESPSPREMTPDRPAVPRTAVPRATDSHPPQHRPDHRPGHPAPSA